MDSVQNSSDERKPAFALARLQQLAQGDKLVLSKGPACWDHLEFHLRGEVWRYRDFARGVVVSLTLGDFYRRKRWPEPHGQLADEYGMALSTETLDDYGVSLSNWYVKVNVQANKKGEQLFFLSLHPLNFDMVRADGELKAGI